VFCLIDLWILEGWKVDVKHYTYKELECWLKKPDNVREWQDVLEDEQKISAKKSKVKVEFS
jgi:uncharacterized ubiquitin-like protein YukD